MVGGTTDHVEPPIFEMKIGVSLGNKEDTVAGHDTVMVWVGVLIVFDVIVSVNVIETTIESDAFTLDSTM
jgi:hypothetical protein